MLVLSRKRSESIQIGDDIAVFVLESDGRRGRLGINAPKEIPVLRAELEKLVSESPTGSASEGGCID